MPIPGADSTSKLFVGGLASTTDEDILRQFFEQWGGTIVDAVVMRDPGTKRSRGFGFVTFENDDQLDAAMTHRPHTINSKEVDTKRAVPREFQNKAEAQISSKKVYMSGVKPEHTEEMIRDYFSQFGDVLEVDIALDKNTGQRRGFAFIKFDDYDPVDKIVLKKNHMIGGKRCDCRKALSKEEMAKVQQQDMDRQARGQRSRGGGTGGFDRGGSQGNGYGGGNYGGGYGGGRGAAPPSNWGAAPGPINPVPPPASYDYSAPGGYPAQRPNNWAPQPQTGYPSAPQNWNAPAYPDHNAPPAPTYNAYPPAAPAAPAPAYGANGYDGAAYGGMNKGPYQQQNYRNDANASWGQPRNY